MSVLDLADAVDPMVAGGKAAGLATLVQAGFPVPVGVVIPAGMNIDPVVLWNRLGVSTVAVRSSGVAEDGATTSQAGMFETVLGVTGPDALGAAIAEVRRSAQGARAAAAGANDSPLAVLVQQQVAAVASGVAFTADPVTGSRQVVVIGAISGLGVTLVDGSDGGDEWRVLDRRTIPVRTRLDVLDTDQVLAIADLARGVEASKGHPQDIEWAWDATRLWLLQARPMTGLPSVARERRWRLPVNRSGGN